MNRTCATRIIKYHLKLKSTVSLMKVEHVLSNGIDPEHHVQVKQI